MSTKLSATTLASLPAGIAGPKYNRSSLTAGIVHFGLGNFHRAHQAVYLDDLFNTGQDHDWALVGAGVFGFEKPGRDLLKSQDWLTTVVEQDAGHREARVTGSMVDFIEPGNVAELIGRLADPAIRIVSTTITEGGYFIDPASQKFNTKHPDIVADAANPDSPKTVFGIILAGLKARRAAGVPAFTIMCCDNIPTTVTSLQMRPSAWRAYPIRHSQIGSRRTLRFRTRWSTASRQRQRTGSASFCWMSMASKTIGRCSASHFVSG